ncbi:MAG: M28 family peptidase [Gammaproteobacteria bacterium]|nr:M28 family peptidase [Gammaproteobacteria bacterium]
MAPGPAASAVRCPASASSASAVRIHLARPVIECVPPSWSRRSAATGSVIVRSGACADRPRAVKKSRGRPRACYRYRSTTCGKITVAALRETARLGFILFTLLLTRAALAEDTPLPAAVEQAARTYITRGALEGPIRFLSSDLLEGRGPATRGDQLARLYLQTRLEGLGYQGAFANGAWQQPFDIVGIRGQFPKSWSFQGRSARVDLTWREDYIAVSGLQSESVAIDDAELVFVGYGIQAPEFRWDDYKGTNLTGKILVMMNNDPDWDPNLFAGKRRLYYGRWDYKYESAARQGAAGAIIIHTTPSAGYPWQVVQSSWGGEQFALPAGNEPRLRLKAWASEDAVRRLLKSSGYELDQLVASAHSRDFHPLPLGIRTSIGFTNKLASVQTANVGGVLPGSEPQLSAQVVVLSAHHDHFGIGEPDASGDRIHHGAVDNASGCAQVLAIAEAFAALPERPRRSILALFVAGEERGLLGSKFYAEHPSVAAGRIAADINIDGGNIFGRTRDATSIALGKSSLDAVAARVAATQGRTVKGDQFPDRGYYYRSDQFSFARIGVPALYFSDGTDFIGRPPEWGRQQIEQWELKKYHQPADKLDDSWNFDGMIEDAQLAMLSAWLVAQADAMPTWKAGDEFEAARKRALAALGSP